MIADAAAALLIPFCIFGLGGVGDLTGEILKSCGSGDIGIIGERLKSGGPVSNNEDVGDDDRLFSDLGLQDSSPCQSTSSFESMT